MKEALQKIATLILSLSMILVLSACGGNTSEDGGGASDSGKDSIKIGVTLPTLKAVHFVNMHWGFEVEA